MEYLMNIKHLCHCSTLKVDRRFCGTLSYILCTSETHILFQQSTIFWFGRGESQIMPVIIQILFLQSIVFTIAQSMYNYTVSMYLSILAGCSNESPIQLTPFDSFTKNQKFMYNNFIWFLSSFLTSGSCMSNCTVLCWCSFCNVSTHVTPNISFIFPREEQKSCSRWQISAINAVSMLYFTLHEIVCLVEHCWAF